MTDKLSSTPSTPTQPPKYYAIRNWRRFQHYKSGRGTPPWIKLHTEILRSRDWINWSDATRLTAVCCMLVASMNDGCVPDDPIMIKRVCQLRWRVNLKPLIECGFLEEMLANASSTLANASLETETYRREAYREETEKQDLPSASANGHLVEGSNYAFECGFIKLNQKNFDLWQQSFSELDLRAELTALAGWDKLTPKGWFVIVANALAKKNREAIDRKAAIKIGIENGMKPPTKRYFRV